jgi:ABC-type uncharacterized transport system substrate-binding protein
MKRREFITLLGGTAATWPLAARAQQPGRMRRVGLLVGLAEDDPETKSRVRAFRLGLRDADWVEGSLAHPGGNVTGFSFIEFQIVGKWIAMLKDVSPDLSRVALMFNPVTSPYYDVYLRLFERTSHSIAVDVSAAPVGDEGEIEQVIAKLGQEPGSGLIAAPDTFIIVHRDAILRSAKAHRVLVVSAYRQFVLEGYLMSYGPDTADIFWRAASYVDRILRGEKLAGAIADQV